MIGMYKNQVVIIVTYLTIVDINASRTKNNVVIYMMNSIKTKIDKHIIQPWLI